MINNGRKEHLEWGLALVVQAQSTMIDILGMSFIPTYKVIGPFLFFMSLPLIVWGLLPPSDSKRKCGNHHKVSIWSLDVCGLLETLI